MKRILDPDFRYTPSFATDVKDTFARLRREQQEKQRSMDEALTERRIVKLERQVR